MAKYTTVSEMTDEVNKLFDLLAEAKKIAGDIKCQNVANRLLLSKGAEDALAEKRPSLSVTQRIDEADKRHLFFGELCDDLTALVRKLAENY